MPALETSILFFPHNASYAYKSRDGSVGIVMGCRLDGQGSNPGSSKIFLFSTTSRLARGPHSLLFG
jgi:hypothetical protein